MVSLASRRHTSLPKSLGFNILGFSMAKYFAKFVNVLKKFPRTDKLSGFCPHNITCPVTHRMPEENHHND